MQKHRIKFTEIFWKSYFEKEMISLDQEKPFPMLGKWR